MKWMKKTAGILLSLGLALGQCTAAFAAGGEYTYTVRFFAGAQGTFKEGDKEIVTHKDLLPGERVTFNQRDIQLNDNSKYYVRGIRESGKDNNRVGKDGVVEQYMTSFEVDADMDYVVVYGLLTDAVSYTVNYVDQAGNALAPSETYYGNVGDAPVIAYLYIDGYQPQAYNMTGILDRDASKNVFNFVYTPIDGGEQPAPAGPTTAPTGAPATQPTTAPATQPTTAPATQPTTAPAAPGTAGETTGETAEEGGEDAEGAEAEEGAADEGAEAEEGNGPAELETIGDEEVPLANMENGESPLVGLSDDFAERIGEIPLAAKIGICSAILLGLGVAGWFLLGRRKEPTGIEDFHE